MTQDDLIPTKEILKARRRADYQRHKEAQRAQRTKLKQAKAAARQQAKDQRTAQLQQLIKPASALETQPPPK